LHDVEYQENANQEWWAEKSIFSGFSSSGKL